MNLQALLRCSGNNGIYASCDGTYKLTNNDWVLLNLISETIVDSHGGKFYSRTSLSDSVDSCEYHVDSCEYRFHSSEYHLFLQNILHPENRFRCCTASQSLNLRPVTMPCSDRYASLLTVWDIPMSTFVQSGWITVSLSGMLHKLAELWVLRYVWSTAMCTSSAT
jgi:hypothetical protein